MTKHPLTTKTAEELALIAKQNAEDNDIPVNEAVNKLAKSVVAKQYIGRGVVFSSPYLNKVGGKVNDATIDERGVVSFELSTYKEAKMGDLPLKREFRGYYGKDFIFKTTSGSTPVSLDMAKFGKIVTNFTSDAYDIIKRVLNDLGGKNLFHLIAIDGDYGMIVRKEVSADKIGGNGSFMALKVPMSVIKPEKKKALFGLSSLPLDKEVIVEIKKLSKEIKKEL